MAEHKLRQISAQRAVAEGDEATAAVALLREAPLAGRVVSMDAGPMERSAVKQVVEKQPPPDEVRVEKDHGRIERRELW